MDVCLSSWVLSYAVGKYSNLFSIVPLLISISTRNMVEFPFHCSLISTCQSIFLILAMLTGIKWHLIAVLMCISLMRYQTFLTGILLALISSLELSVQLI